MRINVHQEPELKVWTVTYLILKNYSPTQEEIFIIADIIKSMENVSEEFAKFKWSSQHCNANLNF